MKPPFRLKHVESGLYYTGPRLWTLSRIGKVYHAKSGVMPDYYYDEMGRHRQALPGTFVIEECDVVPRSKFLEAIQQP